MKEIIMTKHAISLAKQYFKVFNNQLLIGGHSVEEYAAEHGTPLYIYDKSVVQNKVTLFRDNMPEIVKLFYAVKANPYQPLLKLMTSLVDGFDVSSMGELEAVLEAGGNPQSISFAGPGKRLEELSYAIQQEIGSINIESELELDLIIKEAMRNKKKPNVSIRVNPQFELHGSGMKMGGGPKQFGIDAERVKLVLAKIKESPVNFKGFHIYAGSQNLQAGVIGQCMERSLDLMRQLADNDNESIKLLNLGGGFGIPYYEKDSELDIQQVGVKMNELLKEYRRHFPHADFTIELGRYLSGECGIYVTRILYKKKSRGKTYLITDGGMNHHLAASGNFGQVLRKNFPILLANKVDGDDREVVDIVGPLCTPLDVMGAKIELPIATEGDLIAIMNSGAYGFTASPQLFLGHASPSEIIV